MRWSIGRGSVHRFVQTKQNIGIARDGGFDFVPKLEELVFGSPKFPKPDVLMGWT